MWSAVRYPLENGHTANKITFLLPSRYQLPRAPELGVRPWKPLPYPCWIFKCLMLCRSRTANHGSCEFMCAIASVKSRRQHLTALLPMLWVLLSVHTLFHESPCSDLWGGELDVNDPCWDWTLITIYSQHFHWFRLSVLGKVLFFNVQCHNTDKGTCYQPWYPKFSP